MVYKDFCFAHPLCLLALLLIPVVITMHFLFKRKNSYEHQLAKHIDSHLIPHLLINTLEKKSSFWKTAIIWSLVWAGLTIALAGPRFNFREVETFSKDQSLVVLLDLSESMNADDIKPSRLIRAKQKIEDLLSLSKGVKIGLIAFAADPHMIVPLTDDKETIRHLLPSLGTDLIHVQGSRLTPALEMASHMLKVEPGNNKAILVITDGGFEEELPVNDIKNLTQQGFVIHSMGMGSIEGAPLKNHLGNRIKKNGSPIFSKLEKEKLKQLSEIGQGHYFEGRYSDLDEAVILKGSEHFSKGQQKLSKKNRIWEEGFYWVLIPLLPVILFWCKRGYVLHLCIIFCFFTFKAEATLSDLFTNKEELGKIALENEEYEKAADLFEDPYRSGVAYYKSGDFAKAEKMFGSSIREEVSLEATYNLGNCLAKQQKFKEAIKVYEKVLKKCPDHRKSKENLEIVKTLLEESKSSAEGESKDEDEKEKKDSSSQESSKEEQEQEKEQEEGKEEEPISSDNSKNEDNEISSNQENDEQEGSQEEQDADLWLNQISSDPKTFLKNKFYIESKNKGTKRGVDPW